MNTKELCKTIDLGNLEFSILIVTPKQPFLEWLKLFKTQKGLGNYEVHFPEEDTVWLIPRIENFNEPDSYHKFLNEIKSHLLLAELNNFGIEHNEFSYPINNESFDLFFDLMLRDRAFPISSLLKI